MKYRRLKTLHSKVIYNGKLCNGARMKSPDRGQVWSSRRWVEYFRRNRATLMAIPWEMGIELSPQERAAIESSLPEFQLGESSDGLRFIEMGEQHALQSGDVEYVRALKL